MSPTGIPWDCNLPINLSKVPRALVPGLNFAAETKNGGTPKGISGILAAKAFSKASKISLQFLASCKAIINGNRNHSDYKYNIKPKGEESPKNGLINQIKLLGIKPIEDNFKWLLSDINIHKIENSVLVIPSTSKSGMHKKWPVNKYIKLCKKIEELGYSICLVGSENDREITSKIAKSCKNTIDLTSKSPPDVIYSVALKCKLIITNDTGPGHIAALSKNSIIWIAQKNITSKVNIENNKHNELILSEKIEQISVDNVFQKIKKILI